MTWLCHFCLRAFTMKRKQLQQSIGISIRYSYVKWRPTAYSYTKLRPDSTHIDFKRQTMNWYLFAMFTLHLFSRLMLFGRISTRRSFWLLMDVRYVCVKPGVTVTMVWSAAPEQFFNIGIRSKRQRARTGARARARSREKEMSKAVPSTRPHAPDVFHGIAQG